MATSSPPAGGTPARHRNLAGLWRSRQAGNSAFNHLMNLIGVLYAVEPNVVEDPAFLERSVLVDGVAPTMSPNDLLQSFRHLSVTAAVLVRDSETGQRVGLVVFSEAVDCTSATNMAPPLGFQYCVPATGAGYTPLDILGVQDNHARRLPFAELFISLIPPQYLLGDTERDFHLRCIFLRTRGPVSSVDRGASYLSRIGLEVLDVRAPACAVIMQRAHNISILVYDDALSTEAAGLRAPLLHQSGLDMYDSSLIPLPAGAHALEETSLELLLLPPFLTAANDLGGRVVLLSGLETQVCDAGEVASAIQSSMPVGEIESVIVHRALGAVLVVLRSTGDAEALVREPEESWLAAFQQQKPIQARRIQPSLRSSFSAQTFERVTKWVTLRLKALDEIAGLATGDLTGELFRLCAVRHPDVLLGRRRCFSDRAVLLLGVRPGMRETDLWFALEGFGTLDGLAIYRPRSMALGVFQSRTGAARLLLEPTGSWELTGFLDCRLALGAEVAGHILDDILNRLVYDRDYST